jgi:Fungal N-terminal domain of STAND proteins
MTDPLSISISTLTVISFASQSCQFLFEFFHNAAEAPKDIQQRLSTLQALSSTFEGIRALGEDMPTEVQWSAEFDTRLRDCLADFRDMEIKMQTMSKEIEKGRARRTWARLKWLSNDQSFNKFFTRVQTYQAMFALELLILQM